MQQQLKFRLNIERKRPDKKQRKKRNRNKKNKKREVMIEKQKKIRK